MNGLFFALLGASIATALAGFGSAKGVGSAAQTAMGVLSEDSSKFGKMLVLTLLPGTQGLYGFIIALFVFIRTQLLSGTPAELTWQQGLLYFAACLPIAIGGFFSAVYQGKVASAGVSLVAKKPEQSGRAIAMASLVEFYAILPFLISFLAVVSVG